MYCANISVHTLIALIYMQAGGRTSRRVQFRRLIFESLKKTAFLFELKRLNFCFRELVWTATKFPVDKVFNDNAFMSVFRSLFSVACK